MILIRSYKKKLMSYGIDLAEGMSRMEQHLSVKIYAVIYDTRDVVAAPTWLVRADYKSTQESYSSFVIGSYDERHEGRAVISTTELGETNKWTEPAWNTTSKA